MDPAHPICDLLFVVERPLPRNPGFHISFEKWLVEVAPQREWVLGPPTLVDFIDRYPNGDLHTYGCGFQLYSGYPPWGEKLPLEIDRRQFEEVSELTRQLCTISKVQKCNFEVEYQNETIGEITRGRPDHGLASGLLAEWEKNLAVRQASKNS